MVLSTAIIVGYQQLKESEVTYEFARQTLNERGIEVMNIPDKYRRAKDQLYFNRR